MVFIEKPENVVLGPLWFSGSVFFSFGFPQCRLPFRCHPSAPHHVLYGQKRAARPEVLVCHPPRPPLYGRFPLQSYDE